MSSDQMQTSSSINFGGATITSDQLAKHKKLVNMINEPSASSFAFVAAAA